MATAKLNREYAFRMCGIGAIMLALSAWSVYDGAVAWPRVNAELASVRDELVAGCRAGVTPADWLSAPDAESQSYRLQDVFASKGARPPRYLVQELGAITQPVGDDAEARAIRAAQAEELFRKPVYSDAKLKGQFIQAGVTLLLAALAFAAVLSKRRTVYVADESGLSGTGFGGTPIPWDAVASVDWAKWDEKGIIGLELKDGRRFKLDGWHYAGMRPVADVIRSHQ
ncbi:MAG: hypothetical protein IJQ73_18205 [Kiritimatiellae bacterium]|nr:hypothetical protein [Kiritimatiellia bacterium]